MNNELPAGYRRPRVKLSGTDGNAFSILGLVSRAIRQAGNSQEMVDAFFAEAKAGDYNHLLATAMLSGAPDNIDYPDSPVIRSAGVDVQ